MSTSETLKNYVTDDGTYLIPVQWSVYSTVRVHAENLAEAVSIARSKLNELPLSTENEYIDDSYCISGETDEDFINAQNYSTVGNVTIESGGTIST